MNTDFNKITCFNAHKDCKKSCLNNKCRYWHSLETHNNCIINLANDSEDLTLESIGEIFNVTRMRICQIEKKSISKLSDISQVYLD